MNSNNNQNNNQNRTRNPRNSRNANAPRSNYRNDNRPVRNETRYDDDYNDYPPARQPRRARAEDDYSDDRDYYRKPRSNNRLLFTLLGVGGVAVVVGAVMLFSGSSSAQIVASTPNYITTQQAYQDCHREGTTSYVRNQKNGTDGALIGGATGAVAGGVIGNQVHGGGGGTAVGAIVGGATGALIGRDVQRSNQPDYVAKKGSATRCVTAYKPVQTQVGYNVQYMYKNNMANMVVQNQLAIGSKIPFSELQAMAVPPQQLNPVAAQ
jgi:uncharacterized protein YcfJ